MKPRHLSLLAALGLLAPAFAQGSIVPYLPKDTIVAISAPDLATSWAEFQKMPLAKMWAEEEVQNFVADLKEKLQKHFDEALAQAKEMHQKGAVPVDPEQILGLRVQGVTFAVTHLEIGMGDFGPKPKVGVVLHVDFGSTSPQMKSLAQLGLGILEQQAGNEATKTETPVGDVAVITFRPNDAQGIEMGLNVAFVGTGILIGTLTDDVKSVVENLQKKAPALGATETYAAMTKQLDANGAEVESFVRFDPMVDFGTSALRLAAQMSNELSEVDMDGVDRALAAMGWRDLGAQGDTNQYVDGKCVTRTVHVKSKAAAGTSAPPKALDTAFLKWVPKDAVSFSATRFDMASLYDTLLTGLKAYDPEFARQALEQLAAVEQKLGFQVRDDFFGSFGDHVITWSMAMGSATSAPEMAFLVKVNSEEKIVKVLKNLSQLTEGIVEIEEGEKRGLKAYQVRINFDPTQGMGGMNPFDMVQPTFAFKNGYLVAGFSASDVKRVFQRMDREDDPKGDIRSNKEFAAVSGQLPAVLDSVTFTDWKAQFESIYQMATGLLAFVPMGEDVPIDMSLLPDSGTLTKHLYGAFSYSVSDQSGSRSTSISPFGPETYVLVGAAVVGAVTAVGVVRRGF